MNVPNRERLAKRDQPGTWAMRAQGCVLTTLVFALVLLLTSADSTRAGDSFATPNPAPRARVWIVQDHQATDAFRPRPDLIKAMVNRAITNLTSKSTVPDA